MKKISIYLGAALLSIAALVSCNKDARIAENADLGVNFRVTSGALTKATPTTIANLGSFKVTAIGNGASYFTDLNVAVTSAGVCTPEKTYYWPAYELGFYAYANPSGGTVSITNAAKSISGVTPVAAAADQQDFVVAYSTGTKADNMASGVALNFRHALSQIKVKATNKSTAGLKINVKGVKVANVKAAGDFSYPNAVTSGNNAATLDFALWNTGSASKTAYTIGGNSETAVALSATAADIMFSGASWMLVPQQLVAWDLASDKTNSNANAYIGVYLQILDASNGQLYPATAGEYAYANVPIDTKWEPGKCYTYTLNFLDEAAGGGAGVDDAGDPVLGSPINFSLTIDDWDSPNVQDINVGATDPLDAAANGHAYVDLGLRKNIGETEYKVLFATCNIGASSPEEYGDYFAWGETSVRYTGYDDSSVTGATFEWSNAPYHTGDDSKTGWSKYIHSGKTSYWSGEGSPDDKLTLDAEDDAASVLWGGDWRMPDMDELNMLVRSDVNVEWTNDYNSTGVAGLLITGKGDFASSSVFLPDAGYLSNDSHSRAGDNGYYWSRSLKESGDPGLACFLYLDNGVQRSVYNQRFNGLSVRPVLVIPE